MGRIRLVFASLTAAIFVAACGGSGTSSAPAQAPAPVTLFAVNDIHGYISPSDTSAGISPATRVFTSTNAAGVTVKAGGLAYLSTLLNNLTAQATAAGKNTAFVAAGDLVGASAYDSAFAHDEPTIDLLSKMGLLVSSVGNHEFDMGITELLRKATSTSCYSGSGAVIGSNTCVVDGAFPGASFQYLAANVTYNSTGPTPGANPLPATFIKTFPGANGLPGAKIGFIGAVLSGTPNEVSGAGISTLSFGDEAAAINTQASALKAQGVNAVVVLIHQGGTTTSTIYGDTTCPGFSGAIAPIVANLNNNVDVVVSGHTHTDYVCKLPNAAGKSVLVTQSGYYGQGLTSINLTFNNSGSVQSASAINTPVVNDTSTGLPTDVVPLAANSTIKNAVQEYGSLSNVQGAVPIGWIAGPLTIATPPSGCTSQCDSGVRDKGLESAAGDFMADAFKATIPGAQIVFVNAGGVRATVSSPTNTYPYNLTYANIATMAPFNNVLVSATMTGAQIKSALEQQWNPTIVAADFAPGNVGEILDVNKEFTYTWDASQPYGSRIIASSMMLNGTPINMSSTYTVGMQAFIAGQIINPTAAAPDGFTAFAGSTNLQYYGIDNQALNAYLTNNTTQANPYVPMQPVAGQFRIHKVVGSTDCGYGSSWVVAGTCANADGH